MRPHASLRPGGRRLLIALLLAAASGGVAYWLYPRNGDKSPADTPAQLRPPREGAESPVAQKTAPHSPLDDLAAAQREKDPDKRAAQIRAALQSWARLAPDAAAKWVLAQPAQERLVDASVVLIALADRPDDAVRIAHRFCSEDSAHVREHGNSLLAVLSAAGEFDRAVNFSSLGGPERSDWLVRTFTGWTELAPADAARAALKFEGDDAVAVVFAAWASRNPAAAARYTGRTSDLISAQRTAVAALAGNGGVPSSDAGGSARPRP